MRFRNVPLVLGLLAGLLEPFYSAQAAPAGELYQVTVTRIGDNVYREQLSGLYILTQMCLELALSESALLEASPGLPGGRLIFNSRNVCPVEWVTRANVTLWRAGDDLYRDERSGRYLRTFACYEYAYGEDALVARGAVYFGDRRCDLR